MRSQGWIESHRMAYVPILAIHFVNPIPLLPRPRPRLRVPLRQTLHLLHPNLPIHPHHHAVILLDQIPLAGLVRTGFTRHNHMPPMLLALLERVSILLAVGMVRVLPIHRHARAGGVVQRRRLLHRMVAEPEADELRAVRRRHVEAAGLEGRAHFGFLQFDDRADGALQGLFHFGGRVL